MDSATTTTTSGARPAALVVSDPGAAPERGTPRSPAANAYPVPVCSAPRPPLPFPALLRSELPRPPPRSPCSRSPCPCQSTKRPGIEGKGVVSHPCCCCCSSFLSSSSSGACWVLFRPTPAPPFLSFPSSLYLPPPPPPRQEPAGPCSDPHLLLPSSPSLPPPTLSPIPFFLSRTSPSPSLPSPFPPFPLPPFP